MKNIGNIDSFLKKFGGITLPYEATRRALVKVVKEKTGAAVEVRDVSIKDGRAYVSCGSVAKSEIFLKKGEILAALEQRNGAEKLVDII